ncbi:hypothetical protein EG339_02780 [Chryseobacterium bernardetii]|uniref:Uncharacterized protein n=1 Tax=Chryseobacterium bernardetii TaxID=1241978 RepID=A0A3G6T2N0_9FLAO|nr:hypothetical protein [Chryseobacterium bernardetii]AZB23622.1 hypothetical protein EG339_02780 [Chryseobacterium bernardetii]
MAGNKRWTQEEISYLKENYGIQSVEFISNKLDRSTDSIHKKASDLKVSFANLSEKIAKEDRLEKKLDEVIFLLQRLIDNNHSHWTEYELDYIKKNYTLRSAPTIAAKLKRNPNSVIQKAKELGVIKVLNSFEEYEDDFIIENYGKLPLSQIGFHLDRNYNSIFNRVSILKKVGKIK